MADQNRPAPKTKLHSYIILSVTSFRRRNFVVNQSKAQTKEVTNNPEPLTKVVHFKSVPELMNWKSWFGARSSSNNPSPHESKNSNSDPRQKRQDQELYGVTQQLIDRVKSFTLDTFKNFPLHATYGDETEGAEAANIRRDLSEWQERHATLALSNVKELSQLRFKLCPRHLKERDFWRIYFTLVKTDIIEYELRGIQLAKVQKIEREAAKSSQAIEVEMAETVKLISLQPSSP
ncbi:hypothetical protein LINPERPRIM_LOCUS25164 [Linum perenne]